MIRKTIASLLLFFLCFGISFNCQAISLNVLIQNATPIPGVFPGSALNYQVISTAPNVYKTPLSGTLAPGEFVSPVLGDIYTPSTPATVIVSDATTGALIYKATVTAYLTKAPTYVQSLYNTKRFEIILYDTSETIAGGNFLFRVGEYGH